MDRTRRRVAVGDALVVVGVVVAGDSSHGTNPLTEPLSAAETLVPFLFGWLVAASLVGVYRASDPRRELRLVTGAWLAGANVGLLLRASPLLAGGTTWPFPLVLTGGVLVALLAWRGSLAAVARLRTPTGRRSARD